MNNRYPEKRAAIRGRAATIGIAAVFLAVGCADNTSSPPVPPAEAAMSRPAPAKPATAPPPRAAEGRSKQRPHTPKPIIARALYMSGYTVGMTARFNRLLDLVDKTELNAVVIDLKEAGEITYPSRVPLARAVGANRNWIPDIETKLAVLKKRGIYPIARITCFRDGVLPRKRPAQAIQRPDGSLWRDASGHTWLDPYNRENWDYNVGLATEAARLGFREIQWDYVRFPSEGRSSAMRYPAKPKGDQRSEARVISHFLEYAAAKLRPLGVALAADVFGLTTSAPPDFDMNIGQKLALMVPHLDYVCPMVYPSHYSRGDYGISHPNASPYRTVLIALRHGNKKVKGTGCKIRPWLQDFSLYGVRYGPKQVRAQIQAARDNGISGYMLWNAANRYTSAALYPPQPAKPKNKNKKPAGGGEAAKPLGGRHARS